MSQAVAKQNSRTRQQWAEVINADWRKSIEGVIQVGRDLVGAREELGKTAFAAMAREDLSFSPQVAQRLMQIARDPKIANASSSTRLPPSWRVLNSLASLSKEDFDAGVKSGVISDKTSLRASDAYKGALGVPKGEAWGRERSTETLPKPSEARDIARATGRMVAASDGNVYSGATEEEGADAARRRQQTYAIRNAVEAIADCRVSPPEWVEQAEDWWLHEFTLAQIDAAADWLRELSETMKEQNGVIDAE